jgi:hypothetical protein
VIRLANGVVLDSGPIRTIAGHADDPLSADELWEKFAQCTARTHAAAEARSLFGVLQRVERLDSVTALPTCEKVFVAAGL